MLFAIGYGWLRKGRIRGGFSGDYGVDNDDVVVVVVDRICELRSRKNSSVMERHCGEIAIVGFGVLIWSGGEVL